MAWLATPLAATAFAFQRRLESLAVTGGWFGRVARVASDALPQAGQLGSQGGELLTHLLILLTQQPYLFPLLPYLLLLSQDECPGCPASAGHVNQSAYEIPEGGGVIASSLLMRCNRESGGRQGLAKTKAPSRSSRPLNGYGP
jgi:hypothetical protein